MEGPDRPTFAMVRPVRGDLIFDRCADSQAYQPEAAAPACCLAFDDLDEALRGGPPPAIDLAVTPPSERTSRKSLTAVRIDVEARGRALAQLPEPPDGGFALIGYAWAAHKRLRELRQRWQSAKVAYDRARQRAEDLRTKLGAALHRQGSPELGALVAAVDGAASTAEEREEQLAAMRAKAGEERAHHAQARAAIERELGPWQSREGRATAETELAEKALDRAQQALSRVEAEMGPVAGDPAARAPYEAAYADRRRERAQAQQQLDAAQAALAEARARVAELSGRVAEVEAERSRVDRELRAAERAAEAAASDAGQSRGEALRHLAREALERGLVPDDLPEGIAAHRATSEEADQALEVSIHTHALAMADEEAMTRGATYAAGLAAFVVALALIPFVL